MATTALTSKYSIHSLHGKMVRGEDIVMELSIHATTYLDPDKYFLLKASSDIRIIQNILELIEPETINNCEIAYFDDDNELLGEFKAKDFMNYYNIKF